MLNQCIFMGRLTADPDVRRTGSGVSVTSFSIAVERDRGVKGAEKEVDFIDCVAWRSTADFIGKYFAKGRMICVVGSLQIRLWDDKDGNKRRSAEINVNTAYFADAKGTPAAQGVPVSCDAAAVVPAGVPTDFAELPDDDGELPF